MPQQFVQNPMNQFESENLPVGWPWRFFMVSFVVFLSTILIYLGLVFGFEPFLSKQIEQKDQEIAQRGAAVSKEDQDKFIQIYSKVINIKSLVDNHIFSSNALLLLERVTHPRVYFTGMGMKVSDREVELDGVAGSFSALSEQLEAFAQTKGIERYSLTQSQLNGDLVQFKASLKLSKDILIATTK